jgi:hypothetical protein
MRSEMFMTTFMSCSMSRIEMPSSSRSRLKRLHRVLGLGRVHARGRLVQEEEPGLGGEGAGDLHPALGAVGQGARELVADALQAHVLHELLGAALGLALPRP